MLPHSQANSEGLQNSVWKDEPRRDPDVRLR